MQIERNNKNQITITLPANVDEIDLQSLIDYIRFLELTGKNKSPQIESDHLAEEVNNQWWEKNKKKFLG